MEYNNTSEVKVPKRLIDQIIGQDRAVKIIRNAARQRRNILLIGSPGTGKSMLAQGMAELMPAEELEDVLVYPNTIDENNPVVKVVKTMLPGAMRKKMADDRAKAGAREDANGEIGHGRYLIEQERLKARIGTRSGLSSPMIVFGIVFILLLAFSFSGASEGEHKWIIAAAIIGISIFAGAWLFSSQISRRGFGTDTNEPKLVVDNSGKKNAPFVDATGSKAGALFGDVKHDPLQSFMPDSRFYVVEGKKLAPTSFASLWKRMQTKYPEKVERNGDYEHIVFPNEEEVYVLSEKDCVVFPTRVMSMNRRLYKGRAVGISAGNSELVTTPEHRYVLMDGEKEAEGLAEGDELLSI